MKTNSIIGIIVAMTIIGLMVSLAIYFTGGTAPAPAPAPSVNDSMTESVNGPILGCTDPDANNTTPGANEDDGSCTYGPKAVLRFTANDGTLGCYEAFEEAYLIQKSCDYEGLNEYEFKNFTTDSDGNIIGVDQCFFTDNTGAVKLGTGTNNQCLEYAINSDGMGTVDGINLIAMGDSDDISDGRALRIGDVDDSNPPVTIKVI